MAPVKPKSNFRKASQKPSSAISDSKSRVSKKGKNAAPPPKQVKTKAPPAPPKKKKRVYTDEELGIPKLNTVTPVGVQKPRGKKKGKVFIDDEDSMMTILAMVNAEKEGEIESKIMKARQMEEIREAKRKEAESRKEQKRSKLEETMESIRQKKREKKHRGPDKLHDDEQVPTKSKTPSKKRVSFA